jgi:N-methylhydantoinase B
MPDGEYHGRSVVEEDGRGNHDLVIDARVAIEGESMRIRLSSPRQVRSYINSYACNSIGAVYLGVVTYVDASIPHNEGMYRPLEVDLGAEGTLVNAVEPAACSVSTSTPYGHIAQAVRDALAQALPKRSGGGWAKMCMSCFTGVDPRSGDAYAYLSHMTGWGGGGAFWGQDGESAVGPIEVAGAAMTGDVELVEYMLPLQIHRYELNPDSADAGEWRGGFGTFVEIGPVDHVTHVSFLGDGMRYPSPGSLGADAASNTDRVYRKYIVGETGSEPVHLHSVRPLSPGQFVRERGAGGGGRGSPYSRRADAVFEDWRNGLVSLESAKEDYGVIIDRASRSVDATETDRWRRKRKERTHQH